MLSSNNGGGYTFSGVLEFLQHEWRKIEQERQSWATEKIKYEAKIAKLESEKRVSDNIKIDLIRRAKMLEYALRQERMKYAKSDDKKQTTYEPEPNSTNTPSTITKKLPQIFDTNYTQTSNMLRRYLEDLNCSDILGIISTKQPPQQQSTPRINIQMDTQATNNALPNAAIQTTATTPIEIATVDANTETPENTVQEKPQQEQPQPHQEQQQQPLPVQQPNTQPNTQNTPTNNGTPESTNVETDKPENLVKLSQDIQHNFKISQHELDHLLKRASKSTRSSKSNTLSSKNNTLNGSLYKELQGMNKNMTWDKDSMNGNTNSKHSSQRFDSSDDGLPSGQTETVIINSQTINEVFKNTNKNKSDTLKKPNSELENITLDDTEESLKQDSKRVLTLGSGGSIKQWKNSLTLRSHFDAVRSLAFHSSESLLLSASEDCTVKAWSLKPLLSSKKSANESEPLFTFRGHTAAVNTVVYCGNDKVASAGIDGTIRIWNIPPLNLEPYHQHGFAIAYCDRVLQGHTDAIWQLGAHPFIPNFVLSAAADNTIRLWDYQAQPGEEMRQSYTFDGKTPSSVEFLPHDSKQCMASYTTGEVAIFDVESGKCVWSYDTKKDKVNTTLSYTDPNLFWINQVAIHPVLKVAITAHEDHSIRFFDLTAGQYVHGMVGHLDGVSSLAVHGGSGAGGTSTQLVSAGHDSSIRCWDILSRSCVQEFSSHRKKWDESIHYVAFHPSQSLLASAGADSIVKIYQ